MCAVCSPRYGFEYGMAIIVFLIGCAFSVVAPLLMPLVRGALLSLLLSLAVVQLLPDFPLASPWLLYS